MNPQLLWIVIGIGVVVAAAAIWFAMRKRRTEHLRARFGPEYDRVVEQTGAVSKAEANLQARAARVERLHIRPLSPDEAARFSDSWRRVQALFVDDPKGAITDADRLVGEVMNARGYPVGDFERRVEDISVDHPNVVMNYRAARDIARDHAAGRASTEDLRQGMVHYRALFAELLEAAPPKPAAEPAAEEVRGRR